MLNAYYLCEIQQNALSIQQHKDLPSMKVDTHEMDTFALHDSIQAYIPVTTFATPDGFAGELRQVVYPSSITLFIICGLALMTVIKYNFGKNQLEALKSFFNYHQALRMLEERRESDRQAVFYSNVLFVCITGIFVSVSLPFFGLHVLWGNYTLSILFLSAVTALLYILKALIWHALGIVFMVQEFSKIYIYNMFLYNRNIGVVVFPLVAVIPFVAGNIALYIVNVTIFVYILSYLLKLWRTFQIIHGLNVSLFYFILYLCTFEILPLLLLIKGCKVLWEFNLFI